MLSAAKDFLIEEIADTLEITVEGDELNAINESYQHDLSEYVTISNEIMQTLYNSTGIHWELTSYGSLSYDLCLPGSDYDIFLKPVTNQIRTPLKNVKDVVESLKKNPNFIILSPNPGSKVQILKTVFYPTARKMDLNVFLWSGPYEGLFLSKLIKFDYRIKPILMVFKLWCIKHNLKVFNGYRQFLLVIFYLQNCEPQILPPLVEFQRGVIPISIYGGNYAYDESILQISENQSDVKTLLKGFFTFYRKLNFRFNVISVYSGQSIPRNEFFINFLVETPGNSRKLLSTCKDDPICLENPFKRIENECNINKYDFKKFKRQLTRTCVSYDKYQNLSLENVLISDY